MREVVLVSHGSFANGIHEAIKMITGDAENIHSVCLKENMDSESFKTEMRKVLTGISDAEQILVFADLQGGSPFNLTLELLQQYNLLEKAHMITGMNLALLLSVAMDRQILIEEDIYSLIEEGREGIQYFKALQAEDEEDDL